jgi:hypothetical protein
MQVGSILIGNVQRVARTLLRNFEVSYETGDRLGYARMLVLAYPMDETSVGSAVVGTATLGEAITTGQSVEIYGGGGSSGGSLFGESLFGEGDTATEVIFRGQVTMVQPKTLVMRRTTDGETVTFGEPMFGAPLFGSSPGVQRINLLSIECRDTTAVLESTVLEEHSFVDATDEEIITALFANTPEVDLTHVDTTAVVSSFETNTETLRSALTRLSERTGAIFYLDADNKLHWFSPTTHPAPISLGEDPDFATVFPFYRDTFQPKEEWRTPANRITVVGAVTTGGSNISATLSDGASINAYGVFHSRIVDRSIKTVAEAEARARVELVRNAYPMHMGTMQTRYGSQLSVGMMLPIVCPQTLHINGSYLIRRIVVRWLNATTREYDIEWGDYQPDLAKVLRRLDEASKGAAAPPIAVPAPGTVTAQSLAGTVELVQPVGALPALPNSAYTANAVVLLTTDKKLYRRDGNTWTAAVPAVDLTGTITTTQIDDNSISTPKLQALAITAEKIAANAITAGKIAADAVVAGTIATGAIRAVDAVFENGAIQSADIANAAITSAKIGNAEITSAKIGSLQVQSIHIGNGEVQNPNIGTGAVGTSNIQNLAVTDAKIATLTADKITAGTINVGAGGVTIRGNGLTTLVIDDGAFPTGTVTLYAGGGIVAQRTSGGGPTIQVAYGSSVNGQAYMTAAMNTGIIAATNGVKTVSMLVSGSSATLSVDTTVITSKKTGWGSMIGTATRSAFDTSTVTLPQLAQRVKALLDDLTFHHALIGA